MQAVLILRHHMHFSFCKVFKHTCLHVCAQGKRVLHYHLPPRQFWNWACGGLAVYDALIILAWMAVNVMYVQQRVALILPVFKSAPLSGNNAVPVSLTGCLPALHEDSSNPACTGC